MNNVDIVKNLYAAFGRGDIQTVLGMMDPEIEWYEAEGHPYMPTGKPWVGPDTILKNLFMRFGTEWDGVAVHPAVFHDAGDDVVVEGRFSGTHKQTGKSANLQICHLWSVKDGRATAFRGFTDTAQLQDVMGVRVSA